MSGIFVIEPVNAMRSSNTGNRAYFSKFSTVLIIAVLVFCCLGAWQMTADAVAFVVTTTADSGAGSLRAAIEAANNMQPGGDFKIVIEVDGTLTALSPEPRLYVVDGKIGLIESNPNAVITGFSSEIRNGGRLTLQNVTIDNSAYNLEAIRVTDDHSGNSLLLSGSNRVIGSAQGYDRNIGLWGTLTINKALGGSDMNSSLILTNSDLEIRGMGPLWVKGGTIEAHGVVDGISADRGVLVQGGKLITTGDYCGINSDIHVYSEVVIDGGTVVAHGVTDITARRFVINGGSVDARTFGAGRPRDGNGDDIYLVTVKVGETPVVNTEVACSVNGGTVFTCITDDSGKLYLWMPEGQGSAEIDVGGTIYRASGPVAANYDNVMHALPPPVVTGVVVTPPYTTALTGTTVQYTARVEGLYNPPQTVTWTVENARADTTIDGSGLLTISPRETSTNLLVTATSTYDQSKSAAAQVAVLSVIGIIIGAVFFFLLLVLLAVFLEVRNPFRRR